MKKAVFFDIDGTLWDQHMQVPSSTIAAIHKLRDNGHYAFIATGRSRATIGSKALLEDIGFDGIVGGCGTYIEYQSSVIYDEALSQEALAWLLQILDQCHMPTILEGKRYLYADMWQFNDDPYVVYLKNILGEGFLSLEEYAGNYEASKLSADCSKGDIEKLKQEVSEKYDLIFHGKRVVEIVPKGFSKASGIQRICEYLKIDRQDTYAFGDSPNDLDMLRYVHCGIAMGNATEDAKQAADYITSDIRQDGIQKGLQHFALI